MQTQTLSTAQAVLSMLELNGIDTLAYRESEEKRLAPIIKASGARVD
jgi:hypothetical protein